MKDDTFGKDIPALVSITRMLEERADKQLSRKVSRTLHKFNKELCYWDKFLATSFIRDKIIIIWCDHEIKALNDLVLPEDIRTHLASVFKAKVDQCKKKA